MSGRQRVERCGVHCEVVLTILPLPPPCRVRSHAMHLTAHRLIKSWRCSHEMNASQNKYLPPVRTVILYVRIVDTHTGVQYCSSLPLRNTAHSSTACKSTKQHISGSIKHFDRIEGHCSSHHSMPNEAQ